MRGQSRRSQPSRAGQSACGSCLSAKGRRLVGTDGLTLSSLSGLFGLSGESCTFDVRKLISRLPRGEEVDVFHLKRSDRLYPFLRMCLFGLGPVKP